MLDGQANEVENPKETSEEEKEEDLILQENAELELPKDKILQEQTRKVGAHIVAFNELKGSIATDLAGDFPIMSNRGMKYIFIIYDYDTNVILASPMKSRKGEEIVRAYEECYKQLKDARVTPVIRHLNNEVSQLSIKSIKEKKLTYQLASPNNHRLNPAERSNSSLNGYKIPEVSVMPTHPSGGNNTQHVAKI